MGTHKSSDSAARKNKYERQKTRTAANKQRNIDKMKKLNPNWPEPKK